MYWQVLQAKEVSIDPGVAFIVEGLEPGFQFDVSAESGMLLLQALSDGVFDDSVFIDGFELR